MYHRLMAEKAARLETFFIRGGAKTILVVDDDLSVLGVIRTMLELGGYNVLMAHSAEIALRMAERKDLTIDLMLLDETLPDISGPDLAESILATRANIKVIFMSDGTNSEVVHTERTIVLLPKPFTSDNLLERVQSALSYPGAASSGDPDGGGTPGEGRAGVTSPLLPRLPFRPPMAFKLPLPE